MCYNFDWYIELLFSGCQLNKDESSNSADENQRQYDDVFTSTALATDKGQFSIIFHIFSTTFN